MKVRWWPSFIVVSLVFVAEVHAAEIKQTSGLVERARAFMESYARDLCLADRVALFSRYDSSGSYQVGEGEKYFSTYEETKRNYLKGWSPPMSFAWDDLSFEAVGDRAVLVTGRFYWGTSEKAQSVFSYTALLLLRNNTLKIRLEDESRSPTDGRSKLDGTRDEVRVPLCGKK